jgi:4-diphosphocytidyl-2-C-methyl-D-erythritol kinase
VLLVPLQERLSAADVYARAQPNEIYPAVRGDLIRGVHTVRSAADVAGLVANDLEPAAIELCPGIAGALASVRAAGALAAAVSGSGPTVFGVFSDRASAEAARSLVPGSIAAAPV